MAISEAYQIYQQFPMRYNSLRSQLNWHSRQQTHHFKKLGKTSAEKEGANVLESTPPEQDPHLKGHELMWLERMMKELQQYKEEASEGKQKMTKETAAVDAIVKEKCGIEYRPQRNAPDKQPKVAPSLEESGKSAKKIKFEVVTHAEKPQSAKKSITSEPKSKPKSAKKMPSKTAPKKSLPEKQSTPKDALSSSKQRQICCPSNTKVIEIEEIKTDPYSFKETDLRILENLWKKESENREKSKEMPALTTKKSVGKIIRNNEKMNKTCIQGESKPLASIPSRMEAASIQNSSYKQYKQSKSKQSVSINSFQSQYLQSIDSKELKAYESESKHPSIPVDKAPKENAVRQSERQMKETAPKSKTKYEKIYIKLQTQKLSQYLCEKSQVKITDEIKDKIIDTNECQKYLLTNRIDQSTTSASIHISDNKKCFTDQKSQPIAEPQQKKEETVPRAKSEQRKFNRCAQAIRPPKQFQTEQKTVRIKQEPQAAFRIGNQSRTDALQNRVQIKLKRKYDYRQEQLPTKAQKLFTLHSVCSDISDKQPIKQQQQFIQAVEERPSLSIELQQEPSIVFPTQSLHNQQSAVLSSQQPSSQIIQTAQINDSEVGESDSIVEQPKDPTQQLTLLFNLLDEGHRGLLTDTNCNYQSLTEQLKLLFSAILNQIRTKKRFYNMQKFIEESKEVMQIKSEVYMNNYSKAESRSMVYRILTHNVRFLRKKHPLMFVKYTHTQSHSDSNAHSKKSSFNYGHSVVIDKIEVDKGNKIEDCLSKHCLQEKASDGANIAMGQTKLGANALFESKWIEKGRKNKENAEKSEEPIAKRYSSRKNEQNADIDMLQPQIYLQKKYGFSREEEGSSSEKMSSILVKTRGYLQNLDSYLKMR